MAIFHAGTNRRRLSLHRNSALQTRSIRWRTYQRRSWPSSRRRSVAAGSVTVVEFVRTYDQVGRYGGEEFLVLLTGCDPSQTQSRAEHIRLAIGSLPFETNGGPLSITISVGTLTSNEWTTDLTANQLLHQADLALYRAKEFGRNCVKSARPSIPASPGNA
jgi:hypothetical protein